MVPPSLAMDFGNPELNRQAAAYQQVWVHEMQAGLARLSTRGREIVVENSNHTNIPQKLWLTQFATSWQMSALKDLSR